MSGNNPTSVKPNSRLVDLRKVEEFRSWAEWFGLSELYLAAAVETVGPSAVAVGLLLKGGDPASARPHGAGP